jgi:hypothetical protein
MRRRRAGRQAVSWLLRALGRQPERVGLMPPELVERDGLHAVIQTIVMDHPTGWSAINPRATEADNRPGSDDQPGFVFVSGYGVAYEDVAERHQWLNSSTSFRTGNQAGSSCGGAWPVSGTGPDEFTTWPDQSARPSRKTVRLHQLIGVCNAVGSCAALRRFSGRSQESNSRAPGRGVRPRYCLRRRERLSDQLWRPRDTAR